jgi:hypothetical protein
MVHEAQESLPSKASRLISARASPETNSAALGAIPVPLYLIATLMAFDGEGGSGRKHNFHVLSRRRPSLHFLSSTAQSATRKFPVPPCFVDRFPPLWPHYALLVLSLYAQAARTSICSKSSAKGLYHRIH